MPFSAQNTGRPNPAVVHVGLDVGSTTVKAVVVDPATGEVLHRSYRRHGTRQVRSVLEALREVAGLFGASAPHVALCGSGAQELTKELGAPFIQEVVANALAVRALHPGARVAIELGGQDAKMVLFRQSPRGEGLEVADMRMNGVCAGGTGAFIDEMAAVLAIPVEEFDDMAARGKQVYDVSGRCGVYAKTDVQPLLNQGVPREDIALSILHAVAKQTIGGLAQGLDVTAPVIFEGGVLTYVPTLVRVFKERLGLGEGDAIVPNNPQTFVAHGAALSLAKGAMFADAPALAWEELLQTLERLADEADRPRSAGEAALPFFSSPQERADFERRHPHDAPPAGPAAFAGRSEPVRAYLGIDSGSTTTKFALLDEDGKLLDSFYSPNGGEPLDVARAALIDLRERWHAADVPLDIAAVGVTGYGEDLFAHALHADCHMVETVAHARAATQLVPDASFVLDIGGQDMKAIWLDDGVMTDIVVNEACSSGCGSFLEMFASTLNIPTHQIACNAFAANDPAELGSRCTVFMNSSIVSEQRQGKTPQDIMAGLCRSIIQNVFTKVVRIANLERLGERIVVQGGTFKNDAVLRALEQYLGKEVVRIPHPGLAGAIGIALLAREHVKGRSSFIGLDALDGLSFERTPNVTCPLCTNQCSLTLVTFSDGTTWVTGNRCPRGEQVTPRVLSAARGAGGEHDAQPVEADAQDPGATAQGEGERGAKASRPARKRAANLYQDRERLLFKDYPVTQLAPRRGVTVGLPRVLAFWETMPFWSTFFKALGFEVKVSPRSNRAQYERGLAAVPSDTVCFPAKLVHGHVRDLVDAGVDRIFMPAITTVPSENTAPQSESMCAVVKGYPLVMRNSDNPTDRWGVPFDEPLFHWYSDRDRELQLCAYMEATHNIAPDLAKAAIAQGDEAQRAFADELQARGARVLEEMEREGGYAMVLASRPYHNDTLVNHDLPRMFCDQGIAVLPPDAVPGVREVDLSKCRIEVVNNYHARMLSCALIAARSPRLEYAQVVSFGCGHDAYLSDEIARLMKETAQKSPLILKADESDNRGPLRIRVRSFVETVNMRRARQGLDAPQAKPLQDPYPQKYVDADRERRVLLVPNTSHAFSRLMTAATRGQGARAESLAVGRDEAIALGKRYVHNDICFPAQIVIGEVLQALKSGRYDLDQTAVLMAKYLGDCRLTHYTALLRKALDDAGFEQVPIATNDDLDQRNIHPGFKLSMPSSLRIAFGLPMMDALEELLRKIRPYELEPGAAKRAFDLGIDAIMDGIEQSGILGGVRGFKRAIEAMRSVKYDRSQPRPRVLIVGEFLLNFHPGANHDIEDYLERNGMEVIEARMSDVIQKTYFYKNAQIREYGVRKPAKERLWLTVCNKAFDLAHGVSNRIGRRHSLYEGSVRMSELVKSSDPVLHHTFDAGEGVLIPGEILHHAKRGCRNFVILQPFGCLPNHIVGRGIVKKLKELVPDAQILSLDYDPDVSTANIENRLQMLIMNARNNIGAALA